VHKKLLNRLNLEALAHPDRSRRERDPHAARQLLAEEGTPLSLGERESLLVELLDEVFGLGPLEPLLRDKSISDILVNTHKNVSSSGAACSRKSRPTSRRSAPDARHRPHRERRRPRVDDSSPMVDARP
jgi:pilus assembly protein CpaF